MRADTLTLKTLFQRDVRYVVPSFQRPYVWSQEKQWEPLWDDVRNTAERYLDELVSAHGNQALAEERTGSHFMGAVVLQQQATASAQLEVRHIIDGQQRLTTAQLLMDAAQQALDEVGAKDEAVRLLRLVENAYAAGDERFKLWPTMLDQPVFRAAMTNDFDAEEFADSPIVQAHQFFRLQVREWIQAASEHEQAQRAHGLEAALFGLLQFVVIDLASADDAFVIFETLNARGTPLLASDLIKNFVLQTAASQGLNADDVYETEWKPLDEPWWREEVAQGRLTRPRLDVFLNYWLVMRCGKEVPPPIVFKAFQEHAGESGLSITKLASTLRHDGLVYRGYESVDEFTPFGTFLYRWRTLDAGVTTPLLLWLTSASANRIGEDERMIVLRAVESFIVRRMLCRMTTKDYNNLFLELMKRIQSAPSGEVARVSIGFLTEQEADARLWPSDDLLAQAVLDLPLYRLLTRGRLRMVLEALEDALRSPLAEESHCPRRTLTIEHVLPQGWKEHWAPPAGPDEVAAVVERARLLHSLGNLTLVNDRLNPTLSNAGWEQKRAVLQKHTVLHLNKQLLSNFGDNEWSEDAIRRRGYALTEALVKIWPRASNS